MPSVDDIPANPYQFLNFLKENGDYRRVFYFMARKQATFFSEIEHTLNMNEKTVKSILSQLRDAGHIEKIVPSVDKPDPRLLSRRQDMFGKGFYGIERWSQVGWYGILSDGTYVINTVDGVARTTAGQPLQNTG